MLAAKHVRDATADRSEVSLLQHGFLILGQQMHFDKRVFA